jgi:hypothetical protein
MRHDCRRNVNLTFVSSIVWLFSGAMSFVLRDFAIPSDTSTFSQDVRGPGLGCVYICVPCSSERVYLPVLTDGNFCKRR